jgi:hypothetical protein
MQHYSGELLACDGLIAPHEDRGSLRVALDPPESDREAYVTGQARAKHGRPVLSRASRTNPCVKDRGVERRARRRGESIALIPKAVRDIFVGYLKVVDFDEGKRRVGDFN